MGSMISLGEKIHNIRITGFFWLCPSSGILDIRKHNISEIGTVYDLR
jgi:hypothetical protein